MEEGNFNQRKKEQNSSPPPNPIIEILAVQGYEFRQTDLIDCMNLLGYRDAKNKRYSYKTIRPLLTRLKETGSIHKNETGFTCREDLRLATIEQLVVENRYKRVAAAVLNSVPLFKPEGEACYFFNNVKEVYRAILIAIFTGEQFADLDLVCGSGKRIKKLWMEKTPPFLTLFNHPFPMDLIAGINLSLRWKVMGYILEDAQKKIIPVPEPLGYGVSLLSEFPGSDQGYRMLDHCFLTGKLNLHREFLSGFKDKNTRGHLIQQGKSALICENNETALVFFKQALTALESESLEKERLENESPGQRGSLEGDNLFFLLLSLLGSDDTEDFALGIDHIINSDRRNFDYASLAMLSRAMLPLFHGQVGKPADPVILPDHLISMDNPLIAFFSILVLSWDQEGRAKPYIHLLEKIRENTIDGGYDWLTAEICALLARLGREANLNTAKAQTLHETMGTKTIVNLFKPVSAWEQALLSMVRMGELSGNPPP